MSNRQASESGKDEFPWRKHVPWILRNSWRNISRNPTLIPRLILLIFLGTMGMLANALGMKRTSLKLMERLVRTVRPPLRIELNLLESFAQAYRNEGDTENAKRVEREAQEKVAMKRKSTKPRDLFELGVQAYLANNLEEARRLLERVHTRRSNYAVAFNLGLVAEAQEDFEAAAEYFASSTAQDGPAQAYSHLGHVLSKLDRFNEAEEAFRSAINADPSASFPHAGLAYVLMQQGKLAEAEVHYRKALEIDPTFTEAEEGLDYIAANTHS